MPRGSRQLINERLDSSIKAVLKVQEYLALNATAYSEDGHGDIAEQYHVVFQFCEELRMLLTSLRQTY